MTTATDCVGSSNQLIALKLRPVSVDVRGHMTNGKTQMIRLATCRLLVTCRDT